MDYAVSVMDTSRTREIEESGQRLLEKLEQFATLLSEITSFESPRGIIFHDLASATKLYSTIPLPAYTSRDLIHISPLVTTWKEIFLSTTKGLEAAERYYNELDIEDVAVIAAHELTHHADFFHSEFDDWGEDDAENMWFEEGMCFFIPRKMMLSEKKFNEIMNVERLLIESYKDDYGEYSLDLFGKAGSESENSLDYSAAFYDYWRSTIIIIS